MPLLFDNSYARLPAVFFERIEPTPVRQPSWLAINGPLAEMLGLTPEEMASDELLRAMAGNSLLAQSDPIALAYAGHQFGGFVPKLGDGRAVLLGEVIATDGRRRDLQLKGSGPTSFSRRGDGRAALGPVLREFLVSEAMHALGVPTTRSLAAVLTGEPVYRETALPGAVLARVAASHLRVGTFEYFGRRGQVEELATLTNYALARHYPEREGTDLAQFALLEAVIEAQALLVAKWMNLGFVHGVMNTDNCTISGETIDYGPCAFLDAYDPDRTFSSIDAGGRYAYTNQPRIALWNMARLAEALLPLFGDVTPEVVGELERRLKAFMPRYEQAYGGGLCAKVGLEFEPENLTLAQEFLGLLRAERVDFTLAFHRLTKSLEDGPTVVSELFAAPAFNLWFSKWRDRVALDGGVAPDRVARMRAANPVLVPRNHRVEEVIAAASLGDMGPFERLRLALQNPYREQEGLGDLSQPPGEEQWEYATFCGT